MKKSSIFALILSISLALFITLLVYSNSQQVSVERNSIHPAIPTKPINTPPISKHTVTTPLNVVTESLRNQSIQEAEWAMQQEPITVTADICPRSAGDKHDYYSEGDYWWPTKTSGPYTQRDGMTNPDNFVAHRHSMIRFSNIIGSLASAYILTGNTTYVLHAITHCNAWFTNSDTMMRPHLLYAQAIHGRYTGRGIGIIDTIHLMEVAQGLYIMQNAINATTLAPIRNWFVTYLQWLTSHPYGQEEMRQENNHGTCWTMQVACFARFVGNETLLQKCSDRYKTVILPLQMDAKGGFPLELKRTKPYAYSIFNLDAMATLCQILNLWEFETQDGKSIKKGIEFMYPYIADKSKWPYQQDVMYWNDWPVAQPSLVFGGIAFENKEWLDTWIKLEHTATESEVIRNLPVRHPLIWLQDLYK